MITKLVTISPGNSKLGAITNISLVPVRDCGNCTLCSRVCYAKKPFKMYPAVKEAWERNSKTARTDQPLYFQIITAWLKSFKPPFFRWHVGGDILNQEYLNRMHTVARTFPDIRFLCFTKMHHLDFSERTPNLTIVASMWPEMEVHNNVRHLPKAWMQNGYEDRVPRDAIPCPGGCDNCGMCWALPRLGVDVVFNKH